MTGVDGTEIFEKLRRMLPEPAIQWLGPAQPLLDGQTRDELAAQGLKHKALALSGWWSARPDRRG